MLKNLFYKNLSSYGDKLCFVANCLCNWNHVTAGHLCSNCLRYGHGPHECSNISIINDLFVRCITHKMPNYKYCQIDNCKYPWSHDTSGHHCENCTLNHEFNNNAICQESVFKPCDDIELIKISDELKMQILNKMGSKVGRIAIKCSAGICSDYYFKRETLKGELSGIIIHHDHLGQFGPQLDDTLRINNFISGFMLIDN